MLSVETGLCLFSIIFSLLSFCLAVYSFIEIKAMQRSTHRVTWMNPEIKDQQFIPLTEEQKKKLQEDPFGNIM